MNASKLPILILKTLPKFLVKPVAFQYVAGIHSEDALSRVAKLNSQEIKATIDILGESAISDEQISDYIRRYCDLIREISKRKLSSGVSLKPTALGLSVSYQKAKESIKQIIAVAKPLNVFIRIDMEDHPYTDNTLKLYDELRKDYSRLGIVVQAYLKRTINDIKEINKGEIRLCKGIYNEPPNLAFKKYNEINDNYLLCLRELLKAGHYVGIATHDFPLIEGAKEIINELGIDKSAFEFQMLFGVRSTTAKNLAKEGYNVRVYVPYGKDWYPYSIRRMEENPRIALHVTKALFERLIFRSNLLI